MPLAAGKQTFCGCREGHPKLRLHRFSAPTQLIRVSPLALAALHTNVLVPRPSLRRIGHDIFEGRNLALGVGRV